LQAVGAGYSVAGFHYGGLKQSFSFAIPLAKPQKKQAITVSISIFKTKLSFFMDSTKREKIFPRAITPKQASDSGLALLLILLLAGWFLQSWFYLKLAIPVLLLIMTVPVVFRPFAFVWLGFSNALGAVMSKLILSVVFFVLVVPIGALRRLLGKDAMRLSEFKKSGRSVLKVRDREFTAADIEQPF
jgi:hypothetical protein